MRIRQGFLGDQFALEIPLTENPFSPPRAAVEELRYGPGVRLVYELTFRDLILFNAAHQFSSPFLHIAYIVFAALIFASTFGADGNTTTAAVSALLILGAIWIVQILFNALYLISRNNRTLLTQHSILVSDESFFEETKYNKSHFFWPGVISAVSRPGFVAVYIAQHAAHVIPNRAFASEHQRQAFLNLVREKIAASATAAQ